MDAYGSVIMSLSHTSYQYEQIESRQVRLLRLDPGPFDTPVSGQLEPTLIDTITLSYEALSYCWGDGPLDQPFLCRTAGNVEDGAVEGIKDSSEVIYISQNLESALRHLRREDDVRTIWIDQICINQHDNDEKAIQLPLMAEIYRGAQQVIVWLGDSDVDSNLALQTMNSLTAEISQYLAEHRGQAPDFKAIGQTLTLRGLESNAPQ